MLRLVLLTVWLTLANTLPINNDTLANRHLSWSPVGRARNLRSTCNNPSSLNPVPGMEYLGIGYDLLLGNPMPVDSGVVDPGYKYPVFDMDCFEDGNTGTSQRYDVPDGTIVRDCSVCQQSFKSVTAESAYDYEKSLNDQTSWEFGIGGGYAGFEASVGFKGSDTYSTTTHDITTKKNTLIDTKAKCSSYCYLIDDYFPPKLHKTFAGAVDLLPADFASEASQKEYYRFMNRFGTHFVGYMSSGSLFWQRSTVDDDSYSGLSKNFEKHEIEQSASIKFLSFFEASEATNFANDREKAAYEKFSNSVSDIQMYSVGKAPSTNGNGPIDMSEWQKETLTMLMPLETKIYRIEALFTDRFFPDDSNIAGKKSAIIEAMKGYCEYKSGQSGKAINCEETVQPTTQKPKTLKWETVSAGSTVVPKHVYQYWTNPYGTHYYICRAFYANNLLIGVAFPSVSGEPTDTTTMFSCLTRYDGKDIYLDKFEVMTNPEGCHLDWKRDCCGGLAQGAVAAGEDFMKNTPLYVGKFEFESNDNKWDHAGYIHKIDKLAYVYDGGSSENYMSLYSEDCS